MGKLKGLNIRGRFRDLRIQSKIMVLFLPLVLLPLVLIGILINYLFSKTLLEKSINNISDNTELMVGQMQRTLDNAGNCADMLTIQISRTIIEKTEQPYGYLSLVNAINGEISRASVIFPEVESIAFVDLKGQVYSPNAWISSSPDSLDFQMLMGRIARTNGVTLWFPMDYKHLLVADPGEVYLTLGKKVMDIQTGKALGSLVLSVKEDRFSKVFSGMATTDKRTYMVVDNLGRIVASSDESLKMHVINDTALRRLLNAETEGSWITRVNNSKQLVTSKAFSKISWRLVTLTPEQAIYADIWRVGQVITLTVILVAVLALFMSQMLSSNLAKPIKQLRRAMKTVEEGNLDVALDNNSQDEIGALSRTFNHMRLNIQQLIHQVNAEEAEKRQYELSLMSAQIKPHFLYNTLDTIYVLAQMSRYEKVASATKALADFYRVALSDGEEEITLSREFKQIEDYLQIQYLRYSDVFQYDIDLPEAFEKVKIPKMTLQPLVENAIYHGLKHQRQVGQLVISCGTELGRVCIRIADNGVGMADGVATTALAPPNQRREGSSRHFGLYSVHQRLQLHYGTGFGLIIDSELNKGTTITVAIPFETKQTPGGQYD